MIWENAIAALQIPETLLSTTETPPVTDRLASVRLNGTAISRMI
jgi:hypothetical protein